MTQQQFFNLTLRSFYENKIKYKAFTDTLHQYKVYSWHQDDQWVNYHEKLNNKDKKLGDDYAEVIWAGEACKFSKEPSINEKVALIYYPISEVNNKIYFYKVIDFRRDPSFVGVIWVMEKEFECDINFFGSDLNVVCSISCPIKNNIIVRIYRLYYNLIKTMRIFVNNILESWKNEQQKKI